MAVVAPARVAAIRQHRIPALVSAFVHAALLAYLGWVSVSPRQAERELIRITLSARGGGDGRRVGAPHPNEPAGPPAPPAPPVAVAPRNHVPQAKAARPKPRGINRQKAAAPIAPPAPPVSESVAIESAAVAPAPDDGDGAATAGATGRFGEGGSGTGHGHGVGGDIVSEYLLIVRRRIEQAKRYPTRARRAGVEGIAAVSFELTLSGRAEHVRIRSADHPWLGDAAVRAIQDAAPFPKLPAELGKERLELEVPLRFTLKEES